MRVGLISDTHGLLRPEVFDVFEGVDHILHAGDIGDEDILVELGALAPVTAVYGNTDGFAMRARHPDIARAELAGVNAVVVHGHQFGSPKPARLAQAFPEADLIVFGHSHQPEIERVDGILVVNPGAAGPRRFSLPIAVAIARIGDGEVQAERIDLVATT